MTYNDIKEKYNVRLAQAKANQQKLNADAAKLKEQADKYARLTVLKNIAADKKESEAWRARWEVCWTDMVRDIMLALTEHTGIEWDTENLRTFGISCECPVFEKTDQSSDAKRFFLFYPPFDDDEDIRVWNGETTDCYKPGSIGFLNSGNNVKVRVESIEQLIDLLKKQEKQNC